VIFEKTRQYNRNLTANITAKSAYLCGYYRNYRFTAILIPYTREHIHMSNKSTTNTIHFSRVEKKGAVMR
jgi:hypothetical protein